ncbi:MAG: hypothetical protein HKN13_05845 [Rhodothermales bacterium]|nr:hypothetical protein [Rhodothermales bacterium]
MAQSFEYHADGSLKEWRACITSVNQKLQACDEDFLRLDPSGRIVDFGRSGERTSIVRDEDGNASTIEIRNLATKDVERRAVVEENGVLLEKDGPTVVGRSFFDERGRLIQYQSQSADKHEYYTTLTWTYDNSDRVVSITKAFNSYSFVHDEDGRIIGVDQTTIPHKLRRRFDANGRLLDQQPPLFFRQLSPSARGSERYRYDPGGLLVEILVSNEEGAAIAGTEFTYAYRRASTRVANGKGGR